MGNIIVYGNTNNVCTTVETLLSLGISGCHIHLAELPLNSNVTCFNNFATESAVQAAAGVTIYLDCIRAQCNGGNNPEHITAGCFTTDTKPVQLQCSVFINLYKKGIYYHAFKAVNEACLVYDDRPLIDTTFHTNDSAIQAAGMLMKFPLQHHADQWSHSNLNSKEVGAHLATAMLPLFDPILHSVVDPPEDLDILIPMYTGAKVQDSFSVTEIIQQVVEEEGSEDPKETLKMKSEECNYRNPVERYVLNYLKYNSACVLLTQWTAIAVHFNSTTLMMYTAAVCVLAIKMAHGASDDGCVIDLDPQQLYANLENNKERMELNSTLVFACLREMDKTRAIPANIELTLNQITY
ncbi:UNVERIFIED_CONTAM: hypothetical protein FKN15_023250 [Acipenser sinensis]